MTKNFLNTTDLDFDKLKQSLIDYLKGQEAFKDYVFEGSNLSVLIDLLSYNTMMNAFYLNMVASEMFLDTAQMRSSLVSHAKELNYIPRSKSSSQVTAKIQINPTDNPASITIPKYWPIRTEIDGVSYTFTTNEDIVVKNNNGIYEVDNVTFYEGEIVTEKFVASVITYPDGSVKPYRYILSSENIDISSIEVTVQESETSTNIETWTRAQSFYGLNKDSKVFFIEGYGEKQYQIVFGNNIIGKALQNGNVVTIKYRDTVGSKANGAVEFTPASPIQGYSDIVLTVYGPSMFGSEEEDIEDIRYNAPRWWQAQERAVVANDFEILVKSQFPEIQAVSAYGGEEVEPKQYGKVIISVKPYGYIGKISETLKKRIIEFLKLKNMTMEPVIVDPEFFYVKIDTEVQVDKNKTSETFEEIKTNVIKNLLSLNDTVLNDFDKDLRYSKVVSLIDSSALNNAIISNDTTMKIIKKWQPSINVNETLQINFDNELYTRNEQYPVGYEYATIKSSYFTYIKNDSPYIAYIEDDGIGNLRLYYYVNDTPILLENNIGYVDYKTGEVKLALTVNDYDRDIKIYAIPARKDIISKRNKFLIISAEDINVTVIEYIG